MTRTGTAHPRNVSFPAVTISHRGFDYEISCFLRPGKGATLAYLHGLGGDKHDFFGAVENRACDDFTVFALDFPGSGNSTFCDEITLGIDDLVEIARRTFAAFGLENITLVGHSMGGLTALRFIEKHPDMVRRFVDVEGNLMPEDCGILSRRIAGATRRECVESDFLKTVRDRFAASPYFGCRLFADRFLKTADARAVHDYCTSIVEHTDRGDLMSVFKGLSMPRLFIYGEANNSLSYLPDLRKTNVRVVEVPAADHWPQFDNPDFFFETIRTFTEVK